MEEDEKVAEGWTLKEFNRMAAFCACVSSDGGGGRDAVLSAFPSFAAPAEPRGVLAERPEAGDDPLRRQL
jgi:hypothetical protein